LKTRTLDSFVDSKTRDEGLRQKMFDDERSIAKGSHSPPSLAAIIGSNGIAPVRR
jgi:hypothetical protein